MEFHISKYDFLKQYCELVYDKQTFLLKFGKQVRSIRLAKNLTQTELALRLEINQPELALIEKGGINPSVYLFYKICIELNIDHSFFNFNN